MPLHPKGLSSHLVHGFDSRHLHRDQWAIHLNSPDPYNRDIGGRPRGMKGTSLAGFVFTAKIMIEADTLKDARNGANYLIQEIGEVFFEFPHYLNAAPVGVELTRSAPKQLTFVDEKGQPYKRKGGAIDYDFDNMSMDELLAATGIDYSQPPKLTNHG